MAQPKTRNVIFIGDTGSGKSSVINLIADRLYAAVSPDATPCTVDFASYDVSIDGRTHRLWDTPGLNKASGFRLFRGATSPTDSLKRFLQEKHRDKQLDLLVFCFHKLRVDKGMSKAYETLCRATRQIAIPVVIAITHLERQGSTMERWWEENEGELRKLGLEFDGHACITCLSTNPKLRQTSQEGIRDLISKVYMPPALSTPSDREYLDDRDKGCVVC